MELNLPFPLKATVVFPCQVSTSKDDPKIWVSVVMTTLSSDEILSETWFTVRGLFYPEDGDDTFLRNVG
jgi:hypothetical protein